MIEDNVNTTTPEWSYLFDAAKLEDQPQTLTIEADAAQVRALCNRLGLVNMTALKAHFKLSRAQGGIAVHVEGQVDANVTQSCVVTMEPVANTIHEPFEAWYTDPQQAVIFARARKEREGKKQGEMPLLEESEDPEPMVNGCIDLGELATQYLSLALDPYPHAKAENYEKNEGGAIVSSGPRIDNPFAALKDWKGKTEES